MQVAGKFGYKKFCYWHILQIYHVGGTKAVQRLDLFGRSLSRQTGRALFERARSCGGL
jgi:hypothetical protein